MKDALSGDADLKEQPSMMDDGDKPKKKFLTRGAGTAGGGKPINKTPNKNQRSPNPGSRVAGGKQDPILNSIDDFKHLEDTVKEQNQYQNHYLDNYRKNQKLFDDDSEEDSAERDNRSTLVKKMFYKDTEKASSQTRLGKQEEQATSVVPASVQKILDEKKD